MIVILSFILTFCTKKIHQFAPKFAFYVHVHETGTVTFYVENDDDDNNDGPWFLV